MFGELICKGRTEEMDMFTTVTGHFDGQNIVVDEQTDLHEGQQVLITVLNINLNNIASTIEGGKPRDLNEAIEKFKRTYNIR